MIEQFHFLRPAWLLLLVVPPAVLWLLARRRYDASGWRDVVDRALQPFVLSEQSDPRRPSMRRVLALVAMLAIIALAGPTWEKLPRQVYQREGALVIALDLSRSMNATDVRPSRLARARHKIVDLLGLGVAGESALVVYAADAFTVTPLTGDTDTILALLPALDSDLMPAQGTRADRAAALAFELFANAGVRRGDLLLVSDDLGQRELARLRELRLDNPGHRLSVLAVGTPDGGPVPLESGGFLKGGDGSIVITRLGEDGLKRAASEGGGVYVAIDSGDADVEAIARLMKSGIDEREAVLSDGSADLWRELGPWLLLPAVPLASLAFRRGALWVLVVGCAAMPPEATAFDWNSLWLNQQQRAEKLYENEDYEAAATLFENPAWRAAAEYRAGDLDGAQQTLDGIDDETALYNRGNALAGLGRFEDALQAWDAVLNMNPSHEDARYNRQALEDWLRQQRQQQEQQQDGEGDGRQDRQQSAENEPRAGENSPPDERTGDAADDGEAGERQQVDSRQPQPSENESRSQAQSSPATPQAPEPSESEREAVARIDQQMSEQAAEQWLRKIPDDPGGLLRRKFIYQYRKRGGVDAEGQAW